MKTISENKKPKGSTKSIGALTRKVEKLEVELDKCLSENQIYSIAVPRKTGNITKRQRQQILGLVKVVIGNLKMDRAAGHIKGARCLINQVQKISLKESVLVYFYRALYSRSNNLYTTTRSSLPETNRLEHLEKMVHYTHLNTIAIMIKMYVNGETRLKDEVTALPKTI